MHSMVTRKAKYW